jgi:hypothetical protein
MSVSPTNVAVGDPITVRIQVSGRGAIDALSLPEQPAWSDFKKYPATAKVDITDTLGVQGTKSFEQVIAPEKSDIKQLPPLVFSYFDPDQKAYKSLSQAAVPLTVRPAGSLPSPAIVVSRQNDQQAPPEPRDIVHIKPRSGTLAHLQPLLIQQPWFVSLQTVPILAWLSVLGWRKRAESLARNPRLRRRRMVAQILRDGQAQLRTFAAENSSEQFFATLFRLLQEQIGEKLDVPSSAITESVIEEQLRPRNVPQPLLDVLHDLFQTCNVARYAPMKSSHELSAVAQKFDQVLAQLQNLEI